MKRFRHRRQIDSTIAVQSQELWLCQNNRPLFDFLLLFLYRIGVMAITIKGAELSPWLLLVFSLPTRRASQRVEIWRKLQRLGSVPLGNSGYLLPNNSSNRERFEWLATAIRGYHGNASVVEVQSIDNFSGPQIVDRFVKARSQDYQELLQKFRQYGSASRANRSLSRLARLRHRFQEVVSIDFFHNPLRERVQELLDYLQDGDQSSPSSKVPGEVARNSYRARLWITRPRPGVDRVTSAWLIHRFIDPKARFLFATKNQMPRNAVPYDMYHGGFGHRGDDCTFETLLKVFRIRDRKVSVMAQIVHDADLSDQKFGRAEGFGIDEVLKGWGRMGLPDREILDRGIQLAQGLYSSLP